MIRHEVPTITEFLLARIAEDEDLASEASEPSPHWDRGTDKAGDSEITYYVVEPVNPYVQGACIADLESAGRAGRAHAGHIARHDPARVLAECAAKRAIVDVATSWVHSYMDEDMWYSCPLAVAPGETEVGSGYSGDDGAVCRCGLEDRQLKLLLPLAAVHSDHPDYNPDWAL